MAKRQELPTPAATYRNGGAAEASRFDRLEITPEARDSLGREVAALYHPHSRVTEVDSVSSAMARRVCDSRAFTVILPEGADSWEIGVLTRGLRPEGLFVGKKTLSQVTFQKGRCSFLSAEAVAAVLEDVQNRVNGTEVIFEGDEG